MAIILRLGRRSAAATPWHLKVVHSCRHCGTQYQLERGDSQVVSSAEAHRCASACPICHGNVFTDRMTAQPIFVPTPRRGRAADADQESL